MSTKKWVKVASTEELEEAYEKLRLGVFYTLKNQKCYSHLDNENKGIEKRKLAFPLIKL